MLEYEGFDILILKGVKFRFITLSFIPFYFNY